MVVDTDQVGEEGVAIGHHPLAEGEGQGQDHGIGDGREAEVGKEDVTSQGQQVEIGKE